MTERATETIKSEQISAERAAVDLIACDIDGTLFGTLGLADPALQELRTLIAERKLPLTLCSGRSLDGLKVFADFLGIKYPMIADNGALIYDPVAVCGATHFLRKRPLYDTCDVETAATLSDRYGTHLENLDNAEILRLYPERSRMLLLYKIAYKAHVEGLAVALANDDMERVFSDHEVWRKDQERLGLYEQHLATDFLTWARSDIFKIFIVNGAKAEAGDELHELAAELEPISNELSIVRYANYMLDIMSLNVNKGEAIKYLKANSRYKRIACIGDSYNDMEFLQEADIAAAVANATPALREIADYKCRNKTAAGVLEFVKYLLEHDLIG